MADVNSDLLRQFQEDEASDNEARAAVAPEDQEPEATEEPPAEEEETEEEPAAPESDEEVAPEPEPAPVAEEPGEEELDDEVDETEVPDVPVEQIVKAADDYPVQAFAFAVENAPHAAPAVLAQVAEKDPALAWALVLDYVDNRADSAAAESVQPYEDRDRNETAKVNAVEAHESVVNRTEDYHDLAEEAARVVDERYRQGKLKGTDRQSIEEFFEDCVDIARGRLAKAGKVSKQEEPKASPKKEPRPVVATGPSVSEPSAASGDDAWEDMQKFRSALGV